MITLGDLVVYGETCRLEGEAREILRRSKQHYQDRVVNQSYVAEAEKTHMMCKEKKEQKFNAMAEKAMED